MFSFFAVCRSVKQTIANVHTDSDTVFVPVNQMKQKPDFSAIKMPLQNSYVPSKLIAITSLFLKHIFIMINKLSHQYKTFSNDKQ